jgi:hypothetical protein
VEADIVSKILYCIFWFMAVSSPLCFFIMLFSTKYNDKVVLTVIKCGTERHEYQDEIGKGQYATRSFKTYSVTYSYEYKGASHTLTRDATGKKAVGSKSFAYINPKKPDYVLDADMLKKVLLIFAAASVGSILVLIFMTL